MTAVATAPPAPEVVGDDLRWLEGGLTLVALAMWAAGLATVHLRGMTDSGLVSVLGWPVLASYVVLAVAIALTLRRPEVPRWLVPGQAVVLVVMVHGLPSLLEPQAAYFTAYLHVGFVEQIARTGRTVPSFDARFAWPGAFGLGAFITKVAGLRSALWFLRWSPVAFNLAYLAPVRLIARTVSADERVRWLAVMLFVVANWVHQDYFSPQALSLFLFLVVLAVVLRWFGHHRGEGPDLPRALDHRPFRAVDRWSRHWAATDAAEGEHAEPTPAQAQLLILAVVGVMATIVVSHQLTPINAFLVITALVAVRRCTMANLPFVVALLIGGWFAVGATGYWTGHLSVLTSGAGEVSQNLGQSLGSRVQGSAGRGHVLALRMVLAVVMLAGSAVGGLRLYRRGAPPLAMVACLVPPFLLVAGQSYGGEVLLRSYLFSLPALAVLGATALVATRPQPTNWPWVAVTAIALALLTLGGVTARYGNEQFEQVGNGDIAAVRYVYGHVGLGATLVATNRNLPWRYRQLTGYEYIPNDDSAFDSVGGLAKVLRDRTQHGTPAYLLVSDRQEIFGRELYGFAPGWLHRLERRLVAEDRAHLRFRSAGARVYWLTPKAKT